MSVLVLCLSPDRGGLELYVQREMHRLSGLGVACFGVASPGSMLEKSYRAAGFRSEVLQSTSKVLPLLAAKRLASMIDRQHIDVMHIHWARDLYLAVLAKMMARRTVKLVYSRHMEITRSKQDLFHRFFYQRVDRLIVGTKWMYQSALRYIPMPGESITLSYIGVADTGVSNAQECERFFAELGLSDRRFRIGLLGRIEHGKGQHILVAAMKKLAGSQHDMGAAIIGHAMDKAYLDQLRSEVEQSGLAGYISFHGHVDNPASIMGCFDVIVLTTYCETFGLVLVEAMRAGVAVIGTNAGGVPEIITDGVTGFLYDSGDAEGLARALVRLYEDAALRRSLAQAGKRDADARFSESQHFECLKKILADV